MLIKAGDWKKLSVLEKQDLLIHHAHHNEVGERLKERQKNKSIRREA